MNNHRSEPKRALPWAHDVARSTNLRTAKTIDEVVLMVDADNIGISAQAVLRRTPDYKRILRFARRYGRVVRAEAFAEYKPASDGQRRFFESVKRIGYYVRSQPRKILYNGRSKAAPVDMDIAFGLGRLADNRRISTVVICSGDSDFAEVLSQLKRNGVHIVVIGPDRCTSAEIRCIADEFYYLSQVGISNTKPNNLKVSYAWSGSRCLVR